jgi:hypothetical protein
MKKADILARRVNRYLRLQGSLKPIYKRLDDLLVKILKDMKANQVAGNGMLIDNYATENKVYRAHGISRYEIKPIASSSQ